MKLFNDLELDIKSNLNNSKNLLKALKSIGKISDNDSNDYLVKDPT